MNLTTTKADLLKAVTACQGIVTKKTTLPMLANVRLNGGTVSATDLYLSTTQQVGGESDGGDICVDGRALFDRVRMMPAGEIRLKSNGANGLKMTAPGHKRRYSLQGFPGEEFPAVPEHAAEWREVDRATLLDAINATRKAISTDETRLHLHSLFMTSENGKLCCAATDGHRLNVDAKESIDWVGPTMVPLKGVLELHKLLDGSKSETVQVGVSGPCLFVLDGGNLFSVKLVDAQFPPYRDVIPDHWNAEYAVNRLALLDAVKAAAVSASERTSGIRLTFSAEEVQATAEDAESGDEAFDSVPCDGPEVTSVVGTNAKYLVETLESFAGESVTLRLSGELDPIVIVDGTERVAVVMPMRM